MLILISPAKSLDFENAAPTPEYTTPEMLAQSQKLIELMQTKSPADLMALMGISEKLAELNYQRFQSFQTPFTLLNAKQALWAFQGDVYTGMEAERFTKEQIRFAQSHLRMLSGLYGLLKPLDLMQPYRLEMGTKLQNQAGQNLYEFWGGSITEKINTLEEEVVINLASNEYFKAVKAKNLKAKLISPEFKDEKNGKLKIISFYAKKARGMMCRHLIEQQDKAGESLKSFFLGGYSYNEALSTELSPCFTRKEQ